MNSRSTSARFLNAGLICSFLALLIPSALAHEALMRPESAAGAVAAARARPKAALRSPIGEARSVSIEVGASKRAPAQTDPRLEQVGQGRMLVDAGQADVDAADLSWSPRGEELVATARVKSAGAAQLRVGLRVKSSSAVHVRVSRPGADPLAVNEDAIAAAAHGSILWTPVTDGDVQLVELSVPASAALRAGELSIVGVSHLTRSVTESARSQLKSLTLPTNTSLSCQVNVACVDSASGLDPAVKTAFHNKVQATALLVFTTETGSTAVCTGTLLNNDYHAALFLTAYHCIGSDDQANGVMTVWNFQATDCAGTQYFTGDYYTDGAILLNASKELDQSLLWLRQAPPSYAVLSGWDAGGAYAANTIMMGMHHPRGDLKKTSIGTILGLQDSPFSVEGATHGANEFYRTNWQVGLVEPGSSGSGLYVVPAGESFLALIGTLFAGPASNLTCGAATTYVNTYSRLDLFYPGIKRFFKSSYSANYTDLWWNAAESGWGINIQHQGDTLFATWFTYDSTGAGMWLVMSAGEKQADGSYTGALYQTTGTPFNQINGAPALDTPVTQVGNARLSFSSANAGTFAYTVNGISGSKAITRQPISTPVSCSFTMGSRASNGNYQDLWYNSAEPGWGVNIAHQGNTLFATWFTYDANRHGMWLVMSAGTQTGPNTYSGALYRTTGRPFDQINGSSAVNLPLTQVGTLTFQFQDGQSATMSYTVNGVSGSKSIQRQVFALPMTKCQ